jgi:hypothetical protein
VPAGIIIALSVLFGLACLLLILKIVFSSVCKKLEREIEQRFNKQDILGATTKANFFGVKSKRGRQIRGNGALVLTKDKLYFLRAVPEKEYVIPVDSIVKVSMPLFFNGKSVFYPLLCVHYMGDNGEDEMAWAIKNPKQWKEAIENLKESRR